MSEELEQKLLQEIEDLKIIYRNLLYIKDEIIKIAENDNKE